MPGMSSPMPPTVAEREAELAALQTAFDEYIASSRELEEELDAELAKMQEKLAESSAANATLASQLENITPQLSSLERALSSAQTKLEEEANLRRKAELAQDEAEARAREAEGSLSSLREDFDVAYEELAFRESELEEVRLELEVEKERHREELEEIRADLEVARGTGGQRDGASRDGAAREAEGEGAVSPSSADAGGGGPASESGENIEVVMNGSGAAGGGGGDGGEGEAAGGDGKWVGSATLGTGVQAATSDDDDYVRKLEDELEDVTEQLIETEQKLTETEGKLADTERARDDAVEKSKGLEEQLEEQKLKLTAAEAAAVTVKVAATEGSSSEAQKSPKKAVAGSDEEGAVAVEGDKQQVPVSPAGSAESDKMILKLKEENHVKTEEEQQLREELELTSEELSLTQEELRAAEEDAKQKAGELEQVLAGHHDEVSALKAELDKATSDAKCAAMEVEAFEEALQKGAAEAGELREEVSNLNIALQNAKNDHAAVLDEVDALKARFDEAQKEAQTTGRDEALDELKSELLDTHTREVDELKSELESLNATNKSLKQMVEEAEMAVAIARGQAKGGRTEEEKDEAVRMEASVMTLQNQLTKAKEDLEQQAKEANKLQSELNAKVVKTEKDLKKAEEELASAKRQLAARKTKATAAAEVAVASRRARSPTASPRGAKPPTTPASPNRAELSSLSPFPVLPDVHDEADEERDDSASTSQFGRSHARSRTLFRHYSRGRARSNSPTTIQRIEVDKDAKALRAKQLQEKCNSLKDQQKMGEIRVKRLEGEVKNLQSLLLGQGGDNAPVISISGFAPVASSMTKQENVSELIDDGDGVDEILNSNDPKKIAEELKLQAKKAQQQKEHNAQLLGRILRLQGNIQVCCRVRPMKISEVQAGMKGVVEPLSETDVGCFDGRSKTWKSYTFDKVWGPDQTQQGVFQDVEPLALSVVDGYNACIFAYGQTGSGKTYTMEGHQKGNQFGISHRTIQKIFQLLFYRAQKQAAEASMRRDASKEAGDDDERDPQDEPNEQREEEASSPFFFSIEVGMLEIYNDEVYDLLAPVPPNFKDGDRKTSLEIRRNKEGRVEVPKLTKEKVNSLQDVMDLLNRGNENRATASTNLNEHSSRSHMVLNVQVSSGVKGQPGNSGSLFLVDLAGSERVKKSEVDGKELTEAGYINKSLSALGNVMEALDRKASHVPYRDSKLTYLLQDSLGGNSKTMMVVACCPTSDAYDETQYALQFATRVRRIHLGTAQRNVASKNLEETVKKLTSEMKLLAKAKERSEEQLRSTKREHDRIKDRLVASQESRKQNNDEGRTMAVLRKNNTEMTARWQKEKTLREEKVVDLENVNKELRKVQQQLAKATRERDSASQKLEDKENALAQMQKDLRAAKDASSAANLRARKAQLMQSRRSTATTSPEKQHAPTPSRPRPVRNRSVESTPKPTTKDRRTGEVRTPPPTNGGSQNGTPAPPPPPTPPPLSEEAKEIRTKVVAMLQKHDPGKLNKVDSIMEKFRGKEHVLLEKLTSRYEGDGASVASSITGDASLASSAKSGMTRSELALARHKERMRNRRSGGGSKGGVPASDGASAGG